MFLASNTSNYSSHSILGSPTIGRLVRCVPALWSQTPASWLHFVSYVLTRVSPEGLIYYRLYAIPLRVLFIQLFELFSDYRVWYLEYSC